MPVFALYNFNDTDTNALDSAVANGAQNGLYINGATAAGGEAVLDGQNDLVKIYPSPVFQMDRGTLDIGFSWNGDTETTTLLSRDSVGSTDGGYRIDITPTGQIVIVHETPAGATTLSSPAGFVNPGDDVTISYSWDQGGEGGRLVISNATTGGSYEADVPNTLTMDQAGAGINQPWIVGAGQASSDPDALNNINQHFNGTVEFFQLSDTVDNKPTEEDPTANPDTAETDEDTPVTIPVLDNDTDPNGDPLEVTGTPTAPNGTVTVNTDGTLTYTPNPNFNGTDTITYTVTDPDGNTATSTVTVTVNPVNDAPVAADDTAGTPINTAVIVPVLANDDDVDGDTLSIVGTPTSADGTVVVNGDGTLTFTPNTGFTGEALINYTVSDPDGLTDDAVVRVTVTPPARDGIVRGTADDNLIDVDYIDPFDADRVDAGDAILGDDAPDDDRIVAGAGNDTVLAGNGDDRVWGEDGDDDLRGNIGNDTISGGEGNDVIDASAPDATQLPDRGYPGLYPADGDPNDDRDNVWGGRGDDTLRTGDDADYLNGGQGADLLDGGWDDDTMLGGIGRDTMIGGEGSDAMYGQGQADLMYGGYGPGVPDAVNIRDDLGDLRPDNGRDTMYGGAGADTIFGMDDDDLIYGGLHTDVIDGGIDEDTIYGDEGSDILTGGQGADSIFGGADRDRILVGSAENGIGDVVNGNEEGDDFDTLDLSGTGLRRVTYSADNIENGVVEFLNTDGSVRGSLTFTNIENVVCFTPDTMIATPRGEVRVQDLRVGDKVITRDDGIQEIRWMGARQMGWHDFVANPHLKPVMVKAGSLGNGLPERDMMLSPNHRVLVANDRTSLYFDEHEVLVSAKHLVGAKGVGQVDCHGTTYIHFMFDRHQVVLSNGAWTESFQPGDFSLKGLGNSQRSEIFELFPELKSPAGVEGYQAARKTLKRHEAALLTR